MKIAIASEGLEVAPRLKQCASYMCYTVDLGVIVECQNLPNLGFSTSELIPFFEETGVDVLIAGAVEYDTANALCHAGVEVIAGAQGPTCEVARAYVSRTLSGVDELCHIGEWEHDDPDLMLVEA